MGKFLKKAGRFLANGAGAGLAVAAVGAVTGQSAAVTAGLQLAAGGLVKKASKAAGREIHRVASPLASMGVLAACEAAGLKAPVELAAMSADPTAAAHVVEFVLNGLLPGGLQSATKNATRTVQDYRARGAW